MLLKKKRIRSQELIEKPVISVKLGLRICFGFSDLLLRKIQKRTKKAIQVQNNWRSLKKKSGIHSGFECVCIKITLVPRKSKNSIEYKFKNHCFRIIVTESENMTFLLYEASLLWPLGLFSLLCRSLCEVSFN